MTKELIRKGTEISTIEGYMTATGFNGNIVYFDAVVYDENGNIAEENERRLTLEEVGHIAKEVDGKNHKFVWDYSKILTIKCYNSNAELWDEEKDNFTVYYDGDVCGNGEYTLSELLENYEEQIRDYYGEVKNIDEILDSIRVHIECYAKED